MFLYLSYCNNGISFWFCILFFILIQACFIQCKCSSFSPIGEVFRARLRQFPALVTCCTIDWFSEWPAEALSSVALTFMNDIPELDASEEVLAGLVTVCQAIHMSVVENSKKFLAEMSRHNYVTPTSYLELLGIFSKLIMIKRTELVTSKNRTKTGLDKVHLICNFNETTLCYSEPHNMNTYLSPISS